MLFCFGRTSLFCRSCASELNNTTASSRNDINKSTSQGVDSCPSSFNSTSSPYFCAIVAVIEVDFGRWHLPILDFREFQKCEAQSKASQAKLCIRGRNAEVDMFAALHLVAVWGSMVVGALGNKSCRRLRMEKSTPRKSYRLPSSIRDPSRVQKPECLATEPVSATDFSFAQHKSNRFPRVQWRRKILLPQPRTACRCPGPRSTNR